MRYIPGQGWVHKWGKWVDVGDGQQKSIRRAQAPYAAYGGIGGMGGGRGFKQWITETRYRDKPMDQVKFDASKKRYEAGLASAKEIMGSAEKGWEDALQNVEDTKEDVFKGAKEYRGWAEGLLNDALGAESIQESIEMFTPEADEDTQAFIDYAASLVSNPESVLRRAIDGDYDYTQFNQGVVQPMMRMAEEQEEKIIEQYAGGDPYGKAGGGTGLSGAGKVARSKFRSDLTSNIANLRFQEQNKMYERSMQGMEMLGKLGGFVDNRKYETFGIESALDLAGKRAGAAASVGSSGMSMFGRLGSKAMGVSAAMAGDSANIYETAIGNLGATYRTGIDSSTSIANTLAKTESSESIAALNARTRSGIASTQAATKRYIADQEREFAQSEAARNQANINIDRANQAETMDQLKDLVEGLG